MSASGLAAPLPITESAQAAGRRRRQRNTATALRALCLLIAVVGAFFMLFPLLWMISTALKQPGDVFATPPVLIPLPPQWHNFPDGFNAPALPDPFPVYSVKHRLVYAP